MVRSLNVPGSPSAALTITVVGATVARFSHTLRHLIPVGNPAPPRPRRPDSATRSMIAGESMRLAAARPLPPPRVT